MYDRLYEQQLVFDHLPRTGGSSLTEFLSRQIGRAHIVVQDDQWGHISFEQFVATPEVKKSIYQIVSGHGAHRVLRYMPPETRCITLTRSPVDQAVSTYTAVLKRNGVELAYPNEPIDEFIARRHNRQTFMVAKCTNVAHLDLEHEDTLAHAMFNLENNYFLVGQTERMHEFIVALGHLLGWEDIEPIFNRSYNTDRPLLSDLSGDVLNVVRKNSRDDAVLYERSVEMFDAVAASIPDFEAQVDAYKRKIADDPRNVTFEMEKPVWTA